MKFRPEKRREGIVSLTQTEIMLVLAVAVLLLLLLTQGDLAEKNEALKNVCAEDPKLCQKLGVASPPEESGQTTAALSDADKEKEITGDLVAGGGADGGEGESALGEERAEAAEAAGQSSVNQDEESGGESGEVASAEEQKEAAAGGEESSELSGAGGAGDESGGLLAENAELKKENEKLRAQISKQKLSDEIGFLPCWLANEGETPRYYQTFDLTYDTRNETFKISPHIDWKNEKADVVQTALAGELRVLRDYPRNEMSREEFRRFSRRVEAAKNKMYGGECKLAVTINDDVRGVVVKDVNKIAFYTIYR